MKLMQYTTPTATNFKLTARVNASANYIAYLFATLAGVETVGSVAPTGSLSNITVDCGFSSGARFVLKKRTDSTGEWFECGYC